MMLLAVGLLVGCQQAKPLADYPEGDDTPNAADRPQGYMALPGRAATSTTPSETTQALEYAAAAYAQGTTSLPDKPTRPVNDAPIPDPRPVQDPIAAGIPLAGAVSHTPPQPTVPKSTAAVLTGKPAGQNTTPSTNAPYALQVTNGTSGRLFIEVQDDAGNIFPVGFMHAGQRIGSQPQSPSPIQGALTVVVRDPDRPHAPELRRYRVTTPQDYKGKTLGVTILPGGRYRASVDGQVYYTTPEVENSEASQS